MTPSISELLENVHVVRLPTVTRFRGLDFREALLCEGPEGWTEFSPFVEYDDTESAHWLHATIEFGWQSLPAFWRESVWVNATIPAVSPEEVPAVLKRFPGCRTAKVKVAELGQSLQEDIDRVRAVREIMGPEGRIRLDANGAWNIDQAEHALHALAPYDLEYIEQPCKHVDELIQLRERVAYMDIPIAADESIRKADDPEEIIALGAADVLVLKVQPLGGISRVQALAKSTTTPVVLSSAIETSVGLSMGVAAALAVEHLEFDCGLATAALLAEDVTHMPLAQEEGQLSFRRIIPDMDLLKKHDVGQERTAWWTERVRRCYDLLES